MLRITVSYTRTSATVSSHKILYFREKAARETLHLVTSNAMMAAR